jgi:guanine nucleotide-binding protein G(i) subunit alpha
VIFVIVCNMFEGAGDSGKSTIAKQMKIIHLDGFSEDERKGYKTTIATNILTAMRTLIAQANKFNYHLSTGNEVTKLLFNYELLA